MAKKVSLLQIDNYCWKKILVLNIENGVVKMNLDLNNVCSQIMGIDGLMYSMANSYLDMEVSENDYEKFNHFVSTFYALWDMVRELSDTVDEIAISNSEKKE